MIKLPKNVSKTMKALEDAGFQVYCSGACVRDSLLGGSPLDWDLITNARLADLRRLFPEAQLLNEKYEILRLDFTAEDREDEVIIDVSAYKDAAEAKKTHAMVPADRPEMDLAGRDFTINALAVNPGTQLVDPFKGMSDIKSRLVRTVGDPLEAFQSNPALILEAVRLCAELNFDLTKAVYEAATASAELLAGVSAERRREAFSDIIGAKYAGKGMRMLAGMSAMPAIIGSDVAGAMRKRELDDFATFTENVEKTKQIPERRLGVFYMCFDKGHAIKAIKFLEWEEELEQHFIDTAALMPKLYFVKNTQELKDFIVRYGMERYEYLHNVAKAHRIVFDLDEHKVMSQIWLMDQIRINGEPVFQDELAIDANDLIEAGIVSAGKPEKADMLLKMLTGYVHKKPDKNTRKDLLHTAKLYARVPILGRLSGVNWQR